MVKNTGEIILKKCKNGSKIDKNQLISEIFDYFDAKNDKNEIIVKNQILKPNIDLDDKIELKSSYTIGFKNSNNSRKNNIKQALKSLDGVVVQPGELLSFNKTTGERSEKNGYQKAKTIKNGTFVSEFGGGVCQVSTVLYNAALLAGLEIIEVHPHSLPISYEKPCFDAMVNIGSSDLVIKNNTEYPIIIATSYINDECKINVYGVKNNYLIVKKYQIKDDKLQFNIIKTKNYDLYNYDKVIPQGEEIVLNKGKNGIKAEGYLEYYKDGVLVKTEKIREDKYNPINEIVLVG